MQSHRNYVDHTLYPPYDEQLSMIDCRHSGGDCGTLLNCTLPSWHITRDNWASSVSFPVLG